MRTRPVWVEISRQNLSGNYRELRRVAQQFTGDDVEILAVVKADAYGHGMAHCAPLLVDAGAQWIGVTSVEEGVHARAVCPQARILVMSGIWHGEADAVVEHRLTPLVWEGFHLDLLEAASQRHSLRAGSLPVHLEIDTGMSRQGVSVDNAALNAFVGRFNTASALRLEGIATHFSAPEVLDGEDSTRQRIRFSEAIDSIVASGLQPNWIHAGNSSMLLRGEQLGPLQQLADRTGAQLMLRPGLSLYGYAPRFSRDGAVATPANPSRAELRPVLSWKTRVTTLRNIPPGEGVGYNSTFRATRPTILALLPLGYADGLSRLLSNRGSVLIRGRRAPTAGRVSMDQTVVDVTDIPAVAVGDEVVILGSQDGESVTAYEIADLLGTIPYEVLCGIAARVPRVLVD